MEIKTLEYQERLERAQTARQELTATQDSIQSEISRDVSLYYHRAWYLPLIFCFIFVAVYLAAEMSTGKTSFGLYSIGLWACGILILNYVLFAIVKLFRWLRLRPVQLSICASLYIFGVYISFNIMNGVRNLIPDNFPATSLLSAFAVPAIIAVVWLVASLIKHLRKA